MKTLSYICLTFFLFLSVLSQDSIEPAFPKIIIEENNWTKLENGNYGGDRDSSGLVFLPEEGKAIMIGGSVPKNYDRYSELTFDATHGAWANRFPNDKVSIWGEIFGKSKAPVFEYRAPAFLDSEGNCRPNLSFGYNHRMEVWSNAAYDENLKKVVIPFHILKQTYLYDPRLKTWSLTEKANNSNNEFWDDIVFGSLVYDPINKETLAGLCRWAFREGEWVEQNFGSNKMREMLLNAQNVINATKKKLHILKSNYFLVKNIEMKDDTASLVNESINILNSFNQLLKGAEKESKGHEKKQLNWAINTTQNAISKFADLQAIKDKELNLNDLLIFDAICSKLDDLLFDLAVSPPGRGYYGLAVDTHAGKIVLFGGDHLDYKLADTWVYTCSERSWQQLRPEMSPSPRAGHGFVWLPESKKFLLHDGYGYPNYNKKGGGETWLYDLAANQWLLIDEKDERESLTQSPSTWGWCPEKSLALPGDVVITLCNQNIKNKRNSTWVTKINAKEIDFEGTKKKGISYYKSPGGPSEVNDPAWFLKNSGTIDKEASIIWLKDLPENKWVQRELPENFPNFSKHWGTAAFDHVSGQIFHWGGGHVAYVGNDVLHYSISSNRYFISHPSEMGLQYSAGQGGHKRSKSYTNKPLMTGHSYHFYAFDPISKCVIIGGQSSKLNAVDQLFFAYNTQTGLWLDKPIDSNILPETSYSNIVAASSPYGVILWSKDSIWKLDVSISKWVKYEIKGEKINSGGPDQSGMVYDSQQDRMLLFSSKLKGDVQSFDFKTLTVKNLKPGGKNINGVPSRETAYDPNLNIVLLGTCIEENNQKFWVYYDCSSNEWNTINLESDLMNKANFNNSIGLNYDNSNKVYWIMNGNGKVYACKLNIPRK